MAVTFCNFSEDHMHAEKVRGDPYGPWINHILLHPDVFPKSKLNKSKCKLVLCLFWWSHSLSAQNILNKHQR